MNTSVSKKITRHSFKCPIFGQPKDLPQTNLPTYEDVLRCCFEERFKLATKLNNSKVSFSVVKKSVSEKVKLIFEKASIPTVSAYRIVQLIDAYYEKYWKLRKSYQRDNAKVDFKKKIRDFKSQSAKLFDVSACKCFMQVSCSCNKTPALCKCPIDINCTCEKRNKIPLIEQRFIYLHREYGLGKIGNLDQKGTIKLKKKLDRNAKILKNTESQPNLEKKSIELNDYHLGETQPQPSCSFDVPVRGRLQTDDDDFDSDEYRPSISLKRKSPWQMRIKLITTALHCDRYGVSDRAAAIIPTSVLEDIGLVTETDTSKESIGIK